MAQPLVSIGIPTYNAAKFIRMAIQSVLNQSYTNFELIITDDGSSDNTVNIVSSFRDPRIILVSDLENKGISFRLNQQIRMSRGKYFARMDADDIMLPDRIERQVKYLETHPAVDVIGGGAYIIDDDNHLVGLRINPTKTRITPQTWLKGLMFIHPTVMGKRGFFEEYKYSEKLTGIEDSDLWCRSSANRLLFILPEYFIFYRDPLKFKLSTYLFRRRQNRKRWRSKECIQMFGFRICMKGIITSYGKSIIATLFSILGLEKRLISKRNKLVSTNEHSQWDNYLQNFINDTH